MPCKIEVLPCQCMHLCLQSSQDTNRLVVSSTLGSPQVNMVKHHNHVFAKLVHWVKECNLTYSQLLINKITIHFTCKNGNSYRTVLVRGEAKLTDGITLAFEVQVVIPHAFQKNQEQPPWHPMAVPEYVHRIYWIGRVQVVSLECVGPTFSIFLDIVPTWPHRSSMHNTTRKRLLVAHLFWAPVAHQWCATTSRPLLSVTSGAYLVCHL
jgi:hypothetical protein